ncbi:hypothetical protein J6W78_03670 [bacterium]|nr:hypothetical protein [bacterium]
MTDGKKTENGKKGMSTGQKWAAGLGVAGAIGLGAYALWKQSKSDDEETAKKTDFPQENRLKNVGNIMKDKFYIHRVEIEQKLLDKTVDHCRSVNLVGMRKIGKSSLIYNVFEVRSAEYYQKNIIVAKVLSKVSDSADVFFKNMTQSICEVIEREAGFWGDCEDALQLNEKIKSENIEKDGYFTLYKFFETIKSYGKRVVCIVDDFYNSSELLKNYSGFFTVLKELVTNPSRYGTAFVFVSETSVKELDFIGDNKFYLRGFSDTELENYYRYNKISENSLNYEETAYLKYFKEFAGCHPYWLDLIFKAYKEEKDSGRQVDFGMISRSKMKLIHDEFEKTLNSLGENLKNKLYQIVFGPMDSTCTQIDIDTLYDYGIIIDIDNENPKLISGGLYEYMKMKEKEVEFFPLWNKTETGLRRILKSKMKKEYSERWEDKILYVYILKNPENIMQILQNYFFPNDVPRQNAKNYECQGKIYTRKQYQLSYDLKKAEELKENMIKDQQSGTIKSDIEISILEALFTKSLFFLYEFEYDKLKLKEIFGDYKKFTEKAKHLSVARNPYQHNNGYMLTDDYRKKTTDYCKYLCDCIRKAEEVNPAQQQ